MVRTLAIGWKGGVLSLGRLLCDTIKFLGDGDVQVQRTDHTPMLLHTSMLSTPQCYLLVVVGTHASMFKRRKVTMLQCYLMSKSGLHLNVVHNSTLLHASM